MSAPGDWDARAREALDDFRDWRDRSEEPTPAQPASGLPERLERMAAGLRPDEARDLRQAADEIRRLREDTRCSFALGGPGDGRVYGSHTSIRAAEQRMGGG